MRASAIALALAGTVGVASTARPDVTVSGERVTVQVQAMPVAAVLDHLARATGMKVSYEGGTPRAPVTLHRTGLTPPDAVLAVMEGLGLSYALIMDRAGTKVDSLVVIAGPVRPRSSVTPTAPRARPEREEPVAHDVAGGSDIPDTEEPASENAADEMNAETGEETVAPAAGGPPIPPGGAPSIQPTPLPWPPPGPPVNPVRSNRDEKQE